MRMNYRNKYKGGEPQTWGAFLDAPVVSADKADFLLSCLPVSGGSRAEWMFRLNLDKKIRLKQKSKNK